MGIRTVVASTGTLCLLLTVSGGCPEPSDDVLEKPDGGGKDGSDSAAGQRIEVLNEANPSRELDILFMIDDSGSMRQEQENLQRNFPRFIKVLEALRGGLPNVHIGVISSNAGAGNVLIPGNPSCNHPGGHRGQFQPPTNSGLENGNKFIISSNNGTQDNIVEGSTIAGVFSRMADLGTGGCGYEHQLQSIRVALSETQTPSNANFLRPNAALAIIMVTDEDDCSAPPETDFFVDESYPISQQQPSLRCALVGHRCNGAFPPVGLFQTPLSNCVADESGGGKLIPVAEFVKDILKLKPNRRDRIMVSAIMGWPKDPSSTNYAIFRDPAATPSRLDLEPVCASANGSAAPGLRLNQFVNAFGGIVESICQDDFGYALERVASVIGRKLDTGCFPAKLLDTDLDGRNLAFVPDCQVTQRVPNDATGLAAETRIPNQCDNQTDPAASTNKPCYAITRDSSCAETTLVSAWRVEVHRKGAAAPGTIDVVSCRTCPDDPRAPENLTGLCQ